jgi:site-specific recombinase XerD
MKKSKFTEEQIAFALRQAETGTRVAEVCRKAGISELRFHDLRHTFATNLVMSGTDLVTVKEILGHSDISMTVRYSHPSDGREMGAVERLVHKRWVAADGKDGHNLVTIQ